MKKINNAEIDISDLEPGKHCAAPKSDDKKAIEGLEDYLYNAEYIKSIGPKDKLTASCISKIPDIPENIQQKSFVITGYVDYSYVYTKTGKIKVDFGAMSKCTCTDNGKEETIYICSCDDCDNLCSSHGLGSKEDCV